MQDRDLLHRICSAQYIDTVASALAKVAASDWCVICYIAVCSPIQWFS